jgi:hypothetical protein
LTILVKRVFEQTSPLILLILVLIFSLIIWLAMSFRTAKNFPTEWIMRGIAVLLLAGVILIVYTLVSEYVPPLRVLRQWDFEDGKTQNWGALLHDRVEQSTDIKVSGDVAQEKYSLKVINFDQPTEDGNARKKLIAIHVNPADLSRVRYIKADVFLPNEVASTVGYADIKIFLKDAASAWHDNVDGDEGFRVDHFNGQWVTVEWRLPLQRIFWTGPWKDYFGLQVYVKNDFKGPIYIDNITLYK